MTHAGKWWDPKSRQWRDRPFTTEDAKAQITPARVETITRPLEPMTSTTGVFSQGNGVRQAPPKDGTSWDGTLGGL